MDIPVQRNRSPLARYRRWIFTAAIVGGTLALTTVALGRLRAEPPSVARAGLWCGTVERGEMLREVFTRPPFDPAILKEPPKK